MSSHLKDPINLQSIYHGISNYRWVIYLGELLSEKGNAEVQAPPSAFEADNRNINLAQNGE